MFQFKFTVITVCYNAEMDIGRTIESIIKQTYKNYEYIVIDGKSSDKTFSIVKSYIKDFESQEIRYLISSEKDNGIYNAMNKGISKAQGEWIIFMNAGDTFYDNTILSKISEIDKDEKYDVIYGDTIYKEENLYKYVKSKDLDSIIYGLPFCHQSTFTNFRLFSEKLYDEEYKICADLEFYLAAYFQKCRFKYVNMPISIFGLGGFSALHNEQLRQEIISIIKKRPEIEIAKRKEIEKNILLIQKDTAFKKCKKCLKKYIPHFLLKYYNMFISKIYGWSSDIPSN